MSTPNFNALFRQFRDEVPSPETQRVIATAIGACLEEVKDRLSYWEKTHLASALSALAWNLHSRRKPTDAWLRLALVNAEKALAPSSKRNDNYGRSDPEINKLTYQQLKKELQQLALEIGRADPASRGRG